MLLTLYRLAVLPTLPLVRGILSRRLARGKEDPTRFDERMGRASAPRPPGKLVWMHAASVGESLSLLSLITLLKERQPDLGLLVTTGTVSSAKMMALRLPAGVIHQYMPVDYPLWTERFLKHWQPSAVVWAESDLWPSMLGGLQHRHVPAVLVNARMSARSFDRWWCARPLIRAVLSTFAACLAQTREDADRLSTLGAPSVRVLPNLKYAAQPLPDDPGAREALARAIGNRPTLVWASTHAGEEDIAAATHVALLADVPDLLTIIAPRHTQRGDDLAQSLRARGLVVGQRSTGALPDAATQIYLADTMGELGTLYRLCPTVIMGGTFADVGGHNPIEPAQLGAVVVCGPQTYNFTAICAEFTTANAMLSVRDPWALVPVLRERLLTPDHHAAMGVNAQRWCETQAGVVEDVYGEIVALLTPSVKEKTA